MGFLRKIPWADGFFTLTMLAFGAFVFRTCLDRGFDAYSVCIVVFSVFAALAYALRVGYRFRFAPAEDLRWPKEDFDWRVHRVRELLPEPSPPGWSAPVHVRGTATWTVDTTHERLALVLVRRDGVVHVRITIAPRAGVTAVSDERCTDLLGTMRNLLEVAEIAARPEDPQARVWLGALCDPKRPVSLPDGPPPLRERRLPAPLVAARRHLPERLPPGWSIPMAVTEDHGTLWKNGAWAFAVDEQLVIACLSASKEGTNLMVAILRGDGSRASESAALDVLKHFRDVVEFVQVDEPGEIEGGTLYLGNISHTRKRPATADLN